MTRRLMRRLGSFLLFCLGIVVGAAGCVLVCWVLDIRAQSAAVE